LGELNITEGLAGTLIDERIMLQREKEVRTKRANLKEITAKCHATAKVQLTNEKRCTAGLVASLGKFSLDQEVLGYARQVIERQQEKQCNQELRRKDEHDMLSAQVQAIREKNLDHPRNLFI
jgi:hypothetical protein